jgi:small subunit ribosomal protein S19e
MASIFDVNQTELIEKAAEELKKIPEIKAPEWAVFAKTGAHKERPPLNPDWWYVRAASVLRKIYLKGPIGVSKLRTLYGGKKDRGMKPEKFVRGSGNILRKALQQLEKAGLAKQVEKSLHKGRVITPKGKSLLDKTATQIQKSSPKPKVEAPKPKPEPKKVEETKPEVKKEAKPAEQKPQQEKNG